MVHSDNRQTHLVAECRPAVRPRCYFVVVQSGPVVCNYCRNVSLRETLQLLWRRQRAHHANTLHGPIRSVWAARATMHRGQCIETEKDPQAKFCVGCNQDGVAIWHFSPILCRHNLVTLQGTELTFFMFKKYFVCVFKLLFLNFALAVVLTICTCMNQ